MTQTLRRELRNKFVVILMGDSDTGAPNIDRLAERLADAALTVSGLQKRDNMPADWLLAGGVSSEEIARLNAKEIAQKDITDHYERKMGYNVLPWDSDKDLEALRRFLMTKSKDEIDQFAEWSKAKFCPLSPAKARQKPRLVIECWPQAVADKPVSDPRIKLWVDGKPVE